MLNERKTNQERFNARVAWKENSNKVQQLENTILKCLESHTIPSDDIADQYSRALALAQLQWQRFYRLSEKSAKEDYVEETDDENRGNFKS